MRKREMVRVRMGEGKSGSGPGGECICPECEKILKHIVGVPCYEIECQECGTRMRKK